MANVSPEKLHGYGVTAEKNLEQLATGLAQAGAPENVVKTVSQMAEACRTIIKGLAGAAQAAPAPEQQAAQPTMDSATNDMTSQLKANRGGR
jgi:uncharacterized membrane protein YccC